MSCWHWTVVDVGGAVLALALVAAPLLLELAIGR